MFSSYEAEHGRVQVTQGMWWWRNNENKGDDDMLFKENL